MLFSEFTSYCQKLEATSSRLQLIEILSQLFKEVKSSDDIQKMCYLVQGRIAPFFEPTEIGMAERTVAQAVAQAYDVERDHVIKEFNRIGDMGLAVEKFAKEKKERHSREGGNPGILGSSPRMTDGKITVDEVFIVLTHIANTSGEGTVEKRITLLSDLLKKIDPVSAKHLVRIPLGNTRLGIGDPTVLDGLATAKLGDKSQRKLLEDAYNKTSDLGLIGATLWEHGLPGVEKLKVMVGHPIRSMLCERLPNPQKTIEKMGEVDVQYKYDGFRVQIHKDGEHVRMFSRNLEEMTHMFPSLLKGPENKSKHALQF